MNHLSILLLLLLLILLLLYKNTGMNEAFEYSDLLLLSFNNHVDILRYQRYYQGLVTDKPARSRPCCFNKYSSFVLYHHLAGDHMESRNAKKGLEKEFLIMPVGEKIFFSLSLFLSFSLSLFLSFFFLSF